MEHDDDLLVKVLNLCGIPLPKQRRSFETYHRILRAAEECASELGYNKTSTQEIAKRADISHGGLFTRFPTKVSIMAAMVGYVEGEARRNAAQKFGGTELPAATRERVKIFVGDYWQFVQTSQFAAIDDVWEASRTDQQLQEALRPVIVADVRAGDLTFYFPELPNGVEIQFLSQIAYSSLEYLSFNHSAGAEDDAQAKLQFVVDLVCREIECLVVKARS
ncbi:TetR/AcrR family transcriptional regulator [Pseudomonas monteilii]|uniref:TetR/AcrR family transcriptional regulator n=1 Tax=Pseudomonas monteilii TaxID=76759 RepID=UPI00383A5C6D